MNKADAVSKIYFGVYNYKISFHKAGFNSDDLPL